MKNKDPYSELIEVIRDEGAKYNPPSLVFGEVLSTSPLLVFCDGVQIDKDNIKMPPDLLLGKGDNVAILQTRDKQAFVIICKVVTPVL